MLTSQKTYLGIQTSIYRDGGLYISGDPQVDGVITARNASAVQWQVAGVDVSGQTGLTYTVLSGDVGKAITARSTSGTIETSNALTALAKVAAPTVTQLPLVVGTPTVNVPLVINAATFTGSPDKIERTIYGSAQPTAQILARGPAASTGYTPGSTDATRSFFVVEEASNAAGSVRAISPRSGWVPQEGPAPQGTLRQVATGSFLADAVDATNQHGAFSYPFTNKVALAAGAELSIKFANMVLLGNAETNGTGLFTIKGLAVEINGVVYPATLSKATAAGGEIAEAKLVLPVALPVGVFRMNYALSDTGGLRQFQFFTHKSSPGSKAVVGASSAPTDQVNVAGGGTLTAVAAGQSYAILPTAIDAVHASKVCAVMGSSTGTGRSDTTAPGAGVQSYMGRGVDNAGFPVKNLALSGDRAESQLAGGTFRTSQLYGVTHVILVTGGNDIRGNGKTAAQTWGYVNGIIDQILAFNPSIKIGVVVLTPVVTGDPAFVGSQTPDATNGIRVQYNTGLTANNAIPKAHKIINVNTVVENVANPENGRFNANYTTDGTHVNSTGCLPASQMPDWADLMAL